MKIDRFLENHANVGDTVCILITEDVVIEQSVYLWAFRHVPCPGAWILRKAGIVV